VLYLETVKDDGGSVGAACRRSPRETGRRAQGGSGDAPASRRLRPPIACSTALRRAAPFGSGPIRSSSPPRASRRRARPSGQRVAIITNGRGPGLLAADRQRMRSRSGKLHARNAGRPWRAPATRIAHLQPDRSARGSAAGALSPRTAAVLRRRQRRAASSCMWRLPPHRRPTAARAGCAAKVPGAGARRVTRSNRSSRGRWPPSKPAAWPTSLRRKMP